MGSKWQIQLDNWCECVLQVRWNFGWYSANYRALLACTTQIWLPSLLIRPLSKRWVVERTWPNFWNFLYLWVHHCQRVFKFIYSYGEHVSAIYSQSSLAPCASSLISTNLQWTRIGILIDRLLFNEVLSLPCMGVERQWTEKTRQPFSDFCCQIFGRNSERSERNWHIYQAAKLYVRKCIWQTDFLSLQYVPYACGQ